MRKEASAVQVRIARAIAGMPFGGIVHTERVDPKDISLETVANYLEALRSVMIVVSNEKTEAERKIEQRAQEDRILARVFKRLADNPDA